MECKFSPPPSKRAKTRLQLQNGYDVMFTKEPPEHLPVECSICLCVLHEPRLIDCACGASFCQQCIEPTLKEGKPCPLCISSFTTSFPDRRLQRTLNSLQVYCSFKEVGCEWVGELGGLCEHLNVSPSDDYKDSGCPFVQLECCYCKGKFQRQFLRDHEKDVCPKRPFTCASCNEYASTFEDVITSHTPVCPCRFVMCANNCGEPLQRKNVDNHLNSTCPLEVVNCSFSYAGCEERLPRKDMPAHINESLAVHMSLQAVSHQRQLEKLETQNQKLETRIQKLEKEVLSADSESFIHAHLRILPVTIVMNGFSEKKKQKKSWKSEPFYTHPRGFKMFLNITSNGDGDGENTHVSVYVYIMRGEFDNQLDWPFRGSIVFKLLDQEEKEEEEREDYQTVLSFLNSGEQSNSRVTNGNSSRFGWGRPNFISHEEVHSKYLKDDTLYFEIAYRSLSQNLLSQVQPLGLTYDFDV